MRAATIAKLAWYRPRSEFTAGLYSCTDLEGLSPEQAADIMHFAECHKDLQFGWHIAHELLQANVPFPAFLRGDDLYVWRAYNYMKGNEDPVIAGAVALTSKGNEQTAATIKALLVADDITCDYVAKKLSIPVEIVKAYEKLFFNVLDRKKDHAYIASIVYPKGRMVEAMENYLEETGIGDLMLRAGYTQGVAHVLYASGLGDNPFASADASLGAATLDSIFMADGCIYAGLGWLHQRKNAMPIMNARLSMQAGKMGKGGNEMGVGGDIFGIGDTMRAEIVQVGKIKAEAAAKRDALSIVPEVPTNSSDT